MTRTTRPVRTVAVLAATGVAASLALTAPAQASTTSSGCTVTPLAPVFTGAFDSAGNKRIQYKLDVTCGPNRSITIQSDRYEADVTSSDDYYGTTVFTNSFGPSGGSVTRSVTASLPDGDPWGDDNEEMYHTVAFRVVSNGVFSAWTAWEDSPQRTFHL